MPERVEQGRTYDFGFKVTGTGNESFTVSANVLQYPGDTPTITKSLTYGSWTDPDGDTQKGYPGSLTAAETASLAVGQWFIHINATDADEDIAEPIKLYITKGWV